VFIVRTQLHICVVEGERSPRNMPGSHRWETNSLGLLILTLALDGVVVIANPSRYKPGKDPRYPLYRGLCRTWGRSGWVSRREKSCVHRFLNPEPSSP
jgi:hypothetical protein